jgi:hypothetical protein
MREVLSIRSPHRGRHERSGEPREPARVAPVAQRHPRPALADGRPRVDRLHRKRALTRPHHQPLPRNELDKFVGIRKAFAEEMRNERNSGSDDEWGRGLPLDGLDVHVPKRRVVGIRRVGGHVGSWALNHGVADDVDEHIPRTHLYRLDWRATIRQRWDAALSNEKAGSAIGSSERSPGNRRRR